MGWRALHKKPPRPVLMTYLALTSRELHVGDATGLISVYATIAVGLNASQNTSASSLSDQTATHVGGCLHLYLELSTYDSPAF